MKIFRSLLNEEDGPKIIGFLKSKYTATYCSFLAFLILFITPAYSLDWNDAHWAKIGCPKNISGSWRSENGGKQLKFENNQIIARDIDGSETQFAFDGNLEASDNKFIELTINPKQSDGDNSLFIKIRPHLASPSKRLEENDCLIKIFGFASEKDARLGKYKTWDIYKKSD